MAGAIYGGLLDNGFNPDQISIVDPSEGAQQQAKSTGITRVYSTAPEAIEADLIVLAVKPQIASPVLASLQGKLSASTTVLSIIAGIDSESLAKMLGLANTSTIIRCMPNTPALVSEGMTALLSNSQCSERGKMLAEQVMSAVGKTLWVSEEPDLDTVTAISGSGPAYFFYLMEAMVEAAESFNINREVAQTLVLQTALGAATMAQNHDSAPKALRAQVTSPGGTTEAACQLLEAAGLSDTIQAACKAALDRSISLSNDQSA